MKNAKYKTRNWMTTFIMLLGCGILFDKFMTGVFDYFHASSFIKGIYYGIYFCYYIGLFIYAFNREKAEKLAQQQEEQSSEA